MKKIENEIRKSKQVVVQLIEKGMERELENMDKLDDLVEKSNDFNDASKMFYKKR